MARPRKNPYRPFLISMVENWGPDQIADAIEAACNFADVQALVLELSSKPQRPRMQAIGLPAPTAKKPEVMCSVCGFYPSEVETAGGPMCLGCAAEASTTQTGEDLKLTAKEEDGRDQEPVR